MLKVNDLMLEVIVYVLDINGTVDHHCLIVDHHCLIVDHHCLICLFMTVTRTHC